MRRRDFITLRGGAAVVLPAASKAESSAQPARVGFLSLSSEDSGAHGPRARAFYRAMEEQGWIEGKTIVYVRRFAEC